MKKIYNKLTPDQINRGVIFSSQLIGKTESENGLLHEVESDEVHKLIKIKRLRNDAWFDGHYEYNLIRS